MSFVFLNIDAGKPEGKIGRPQSDEVKLEGKVGRPEAGVGKLEGTFVKLNVTSGGVNVSFWRIFDGFD